MSTETQYLEMEVHNATPQKLRKLLIDGALRFANQARVQYASNRPREGKTLVLRCRDVLSELLGSIEGESALADQMRSIYVPLIQSISQITNDNAVQRLDQIVAALKEERLTWHELCEQNPEVPEEVLQALAQLEALTSDQAAQILRESHADGEIGQNDDDHDPPRDGLRLSLDA